MERANPHPRKAMTGRRAGILLGLALLGVGGWFGMRYMPALWAGGPTVLLKGQFHQVAHKGTGGATVYRMPDGRRMLKLTDFRTAPADETELQRKQLEVYLISAADAFENETVEQSEIFSLGPLQSAAGDQVYWLPDDLDLSRYRAVTVWSRKYRVNFTTAPLTPP